MYGDGLNNVVHLQLFDIAYCLSFTGNNLLGGCVERLKVFKRIITDNKKL